MTTAAHTERRPSRGVRVPRRWSIRGADVVAFLLLQGIVIGALWVRHGGPDQVATASGAWTALGQVTALYGTYLALIQLVLMSRSPWLDQSFGMDRLAIAHRWLGFATVWLLLAHGVGTTVGYALADGSGVVAEFIVLITTYPYVLMAAVSAVLFGAVAVSSVRAARRRLSYETWHGIHLYAYLAIALGSLHQLFVGSDFMRDQVAAIYWIALYVFAVGLILIFRVGGPAVASLRHRLRVANVVRESDGVVSLYMTGRHLEDLAVRPGQYFLWRFLTRDGWYRAHPFSISAAPNGEWLRITIKDLGDWSGGLQHVGIGTRVAIEGPYGVLTDARRTRRRVVLIAGGIGITPLRALLEGLPAGHGDVTLLYRARRWDDVVFRDEIDVLADARGADVQYVIGERGSAALPTDPLDAPDLLARIPDIRTADVYLCGPVPMMRAVERALRALRVPARQVHVERFAY